MGHINFIPFLVGTCATLLIPDLAVACTLDSPLGLAACVKKDRYQVDLAAIGAKPRPVGSPAVEETRQRCLSVFKAAGFEVSRHAVPMRRAVAANIIGLRKGTMPDRPAVVLGAHIDSVENCNGANDNASGVAGLLEMARVLGKLTFEADLYVACWDAEEPGLIGSSAWVELAKKEGRKIDVGVSLEQIGNRQPEPNSQAPVPQWFTDAFPEASRQINARQRRGDFALFVYDAAVKMDAWLEMTQATQVSLLRIEMPPRTGGFTPLSMHLSRSDHAPFWSNGYPALFVGDTAEFRKSGYHCGGRPDDLQYIDLDFAVGIVRATTVFAASRLGIARPRGSGSRRVYGAGGRRRALRRALDAARSRLPGPQAAG